MATLRALPIALALAALAATGCSLTAARTGSVSPVALAESAAAQGLRPVGTAGALQVAGTTRERLGAAALARNPLDDQYLGVWQEKRAERFHVYVRRLDAQLVPIRGDHDGARLTATDSEQVAPAVAFDGQGYMAAWEDHRPDAPGVYARRLDRLGAPVGEPFRLGGDRGTSPAVATAAVGGAILTTWQEDGRILGAVVAATGAGAPFVIADRSSGVFGFGAGVLQERPVVAAAPGERRWLVAWSEGAALRARTLEPTGALGTPIDLGEGAAPRLAYDATSQRFMAVFQHDDQIQARTVALDGALGPTVELGAGEAPAVSWHAEAAAYQLLWTSRGYLVHQRLGPTLAPLAPATLLPSAGARHPALVYDDKRHAHVFLAEERAYGFDRLTTLPLR